MTASQFSDAQKAFILKQGIEGVPVADICRRAERLTGALLDRLTHHVSILKMNGESFRLATSKKAQRRSAQAPNGNTRPSIEGEKASRI